MAKYGVLRKEFKMLFIDSDVIPVIKEKRNHIIEISGLPDSGTSSAAIYILKELDGLGMFIAFEQNVANQTVMFKKYMGDRADDIILCFASNRDDILTYIKTIGSEVDYIVIDDLAYYLLYEPKKDIKRFISTLYVQALEKDAQILLINQLRFDVWGRSYIKHQNWSEKQLKTLYSNCLDPKIDLKVNVSRGAGDDRGNIYVKLDPNRIIKPVLSKSTILPSIKLADYVKNKERDE